MNDISLNISFADPGINTTLQEMIALYEKTFPRQVVSYYIQGSYADETYVAASDIDLSIVFRDRYKHNEERKAAEQLWANSPHISTMELDISVVDEDSLRAGVHPTLKLGSRLLYGEDILRHYPIVPIAVWTQERMHAAHWLMLHIYARPTQADLPLDFPNPSDEFYGYINRIVRLPDGREVPTTRNLVRTTGWAATALLALQAGQYTARKSDCHHLYRRYIGDAWASLLEKIYRCCREEWQYLLPAEKSSRQRLRMLCEQTLGFEQHFMTLYRQYQSR